MGRLITFENHLQDSLNDLVSRKSSHIGLIIGQCTAQRDLVLRLCPTPPNVENESSGDAVESGDTKEKPKKNSKKSAKAEGVPDLDEQWICQHAKQVTRALPGGLDVLGAYVVAPTDVANNLQPKLRQLLFAIYKTLSKDQKLSVNDHISERILLHICPVTLKCVCRTIDVSDYKTSMNPADWKPSAGASHWHKLECRLAVDFKFPVIRDHCSLSLQKQIEFGLNPYFKEILCAVPLIGGTFRKPEEFLDTSLSEGKKSRRKEKIQQSGGQCYNVELFLPSDPKDSGENSEVLDCVTMLTFKGTIQCRAFVHSRATVKEAVQALKQDVIRSVMARCNIHCEDLLLIDEEQRDPVVVYELPRRVFAPLPQSEVFVSDYQFHGDTASDSLDAFKELLDLEVDEQDVETSCEISPVPSLLIQPEVMDDRLSEFGDTPSSNTNIILPVASATIAALAAGLSYFLFLQE